MIGASWIILGCVLAGMLLSMLYFRRCVIARPPIGVINLWDVALLLAAIVVVPYLYLGLPQELVMALLALGLASLLYGLWVPILRRAAPAIGVTVLIMAADIFVAWRWGTEGMPFFVVNNCILIAAAVGFSNLWSQGGMQARALAFLAGSLALYDFIFAERVSLMGDLVSGTLRRCPLPPFWPGPSGTASGWGWGSAT